MLTLQNHNHLVNIFWLAKVFIWATSYMFFSDDLASSFFRKSAPSPIHCQSARYPAKDDQCLSW